MTWRAILEGVAALPVALKQLRQIQAVGSVTIAHIRPGDAIVIETEAVLSGNTRASLTDGVRSIWPGVKVIILDSGFQMRVVSRHQADDERPVH